MSEAPSTGSAGPEWEACRRFETAWNAGDRPRVEDYLADLSEPEGAALLRALLALEMRYRRAQGEPIALDEYQRRFPGRIELIRAVFLEVLSSASPGTRMPESSQLTAADTGPYWPRGEEAEIPPALGRYRVLARLGSGAFGVVYRGLDEELRREVAIKVPHRHRIASAEDVERYLTEARILASLDHPGIVPVYDVGHAADGLCYVVSKLVGGCDLKTRLEQGRLPLADAVLIVACVAEGLHHAHECGLVHRDIKPANILIDTSGKAVVADFGLALRAAELAQEAGLAGTPQYMSPEQARGEGQRVDARTDIFSLGVVFYELLTGQRPFPSRRLSEVLEQILTLEPRPPSQVDARVPAELDPICLRALAKRPSRRYRSANDLAADLRRWLATQPPPAGLSALTGSTPTFAPGRRPGPGSSGRDSDLDSWEAGRPSSGIDPLKISVSRMPVTSRHLFGRDDQLLLLDSLWQSPQANVVTLVAWGGVGKTALMNAWLRRLAEHQYGGAHCVYAWSFYSQGTRDRAAAGDLFVQSALAWFGDPDPEAGTAWQKGERLARLIKRQRTLLLLDGLEPLQLPPGPQEGRIKDQAVQALLRELAASNPGLCLVSSRLPLTDLAEFEGSTVRPIELDHVQPEAGALLLRALGVKGDDAEMRAASRDFGGHCLALTLLGSYLTDAFGGDVQRRHEVGPLEEDVRAGGHAWRVMKSYENWFVGQPEVLLLRALGLFDRPASADALAALRARPGIPELTDGLTDLGRVEWARVVSRLRRARLLSQPDRKKSDSLDTHPLVREYFGEQLRRQFPHAWREGNNRLYEHFTAQAPPLPTSLEEMEPLFQAIGFACNAGREQDALNDVYFARIMRGGEMYAATKLGAVGPLLSALSHFFEGGDWGRPVSPRPPERQGLGRADQRKVLVHAGMFHTSAKGFAAHDVGVIFAKARDLSENDAERFPALRAQWIHHLALADTRKAEQLAAELDALARGLDRSIYVVEAKMSRGLTDHYAGNFRRAEEHLRRAIAAYDFEEHRTSFRVTGVDPGISAHAYMGLNEWVLGRPEQADRYSEIAVRRAEEVGHPFSKSVALSIAAQIPQFLRDPERTHRHAQELIDFANQQGSLLFLSHGHFIKAWARFEAARLAGGPQAEGEMLAATAEMEDANREHVRTESRLHRTIFLVILAEAVGLVQRVEEALALLRECRALMETQGDRRWEAELYRVQGDLEWTRSGGAAARATYEKAVQIARQQQALALELRATTRLTGMLIEQGEGAHARQELAGVLERFTQGHDTRDWKEAKALLD